MVINDAYIIVIAVAVTVAVAQKLMMQLFGDDS